MREQKDGGPAFGTLKAESRSNGVASVTNQTGMTLRQYAAIKMRVPDSGTDWLDEMILKSLWDEMAGKAMQGMLAGEKAWAFHALGAYVTADAMLRERGTR